MLIGTRVKSPRDLIEVAVLMGGVEQSLYRSLRDGQIYVAGKPGEVYELQVRNLTGGRVEVINTVDGRHTLDDEEGHLTRNSGLVFGAHSTGKFSGWRVSNDGTRKFMFGSPGASIAAQATGSTENVGVIGFGVHCERTVRYESEYQKLLPKGPVFRGGGFKGGLESLEAPRSGPATLGGDTLGARGASLGTGMGDYQEDRVGRTNFDRNGEEPDWLAIFYHTREVLLEMGVIAPPMPNPFPGGTKTGYAKY